MHCLFQPRKGFGAVSHDAAFFPLSSSQALAHPTFSSPSEPPPPFQSFSPVPYGATSAPSAPSFTAPPAPPQFSAPPASSVPTPYSFSAAESFTATVSPPAPQPSAEPFSSAAGAFPPQPSSFSSAAAASSFAPPAGLSASVDFPLSLALVPAGGAAPGSSGPASAAAPGSGSKASGRPAEVKSAVWADALGAGLIDLNIANGGEAHCVRLRLTGGR